MKTARILLVVLALMAPLTLVESAEAVVTLTTPALFGPNATNVDCVVTNVSGVPYSMTITVIDNAGNEVSGASSFTLNPRESAQHGHAATGQWLRCRFVGGGANKNNFRAGIVTPSDALPAQ